MASVFDTEMLIQGNTSAIMAEIWCFPERHDMKLFDNAYLEGPFSSRGKTLTTRFNFVRSKLGDLNGWKATILEPVFWSPRMPVLYEFGGLNGTASSIGLRDIQIKRDSFYWEDRRWVARAAAMAGLPQMRAGDSDDSPKMLTIVPPLSSAFLGEADITGLPLIVDATQVRREELAIQISRLSAHVSATMIILPHDCEEVYRQAAHSHVRLGTYHNSATPPPVWAQFIAVSESLLSTGWQRDRRLPIVATRECDIEDRSPDELRAMCDQFQADLDHGADYAGLWLLPKATS